MSSVNELYQTESLRTKIARDVKAFDEAGGVTKIYNDKGVQTHTRQLVDGEYVTKPYIAPKKEQDAQKIVVEDDGTITEVAE